MKPESRLDIRVAKEGVDFNFYWVLQTTKPVTDRFRSCSDFPTRAEAVSDFEQTAKDMGWKLHPDENAALEEWMRDGGGEGY